MQNNFLQFTFVKQKAFLLSESSPVITIGHLSSSSNGTSPSCKIVTKACSFAPGFLGCSTCPC